MKTLLFCLLISVSGSVYASTTICQIGPGMMGLYNFKPEVISWSTDTQSAKIKFSKETYNGQVILVKKYRDYVSESEESHRFTAGGDVEGGENRGATAGKERDSANDKRYYSVTTIDFNIGLGGLGITSDTSDNSGSFEFRVG